MALPTTINGQECPTEIMKILQALIDEKATVSLNNLNATGEQRFTTINSNISSLQSALSSLTTTVNGKISASVKKAANGYIKFSNGIIVQWININWSSGNVTKTNTVEKNISFPTAFTTTDWGGAHICNSSCFVPAIYGGNTGGCTLVYGNRAESTHSFGKVFGVFIGY